MSLKSRFSFMFCEFDAERDRAALPILWIFGAFMLTVGLLIAIGGLHDGLGTLTLSGIFMILCAINLLRVCIKTRRQIKDFDARKNLAATG